MSVIFCLSYFDRANYTLKRVHRLSQFIFGIIQIQVVKLK
ncbi:protein of unknown function [Clostridium beijerinckii]|nr:protein of unknown function [Clostridium beijerinckii]